MTIHLSEGRERFVRSLVRDGRYASETEVVDEALRLLEQQDQKAGEVEEIPLHETDQPRRKRISEVFEEIRKSVPKEEWDKLPVDGAEQHDHYIYGLPKRPTS